MCARTGLAPWLLAGAPVEKPSRLSDFVHAPDFFNGRPFRAGFQPRKSI